jgi:predicted transcriptional regulator of viral defense system
MKENIDKEIQYYKSTALRKQGISYYRINKLVADGILKKINHTTYENTSCKADNAFYKAFAYVPTGVICLMSAARYYGLTEFIPDAIDVAIQRKERVSTLPADTDIALYYFSSDRMRIGRVCFEKNGNQFEIFNLEKTVIDIVYYRNKIGIEETGEIIRNYIRRKDKNLNLLYRYAKLLRCEKIIRTYMEVLL